MFLSKGPEPAAARASAAALSHLFFSGADDLPAPAALQILGIFSFLFPHKSGLAFKAQSLRSQEARGWFSGE